MILLYGARYSVYTRIVRMVLAEKGLACELVETDVFASGGPPGEHLARHPFGRIPVLDHDGFVLYETSAITRYLDEAFPGPTLQPGGPRQRARMNQIIGILDAYAFQTLVWDIYVERAAPAEHGRPSDERLISAALPRAATILAELDRLSDGTPIFSGPAVTLADLHAVPMLTLFALTDEGQGLLGDVPKLATWLAAIAARPSVAATRFVEEGGEAALSR